MSAFMKKIKTLKGDKEFYRMTLSIALPIMIQNGISNFVSLLDNVMIGRVGTNALSGVAIANQIIFVYFLLIFGATAGVGIFTAQYAGCNDTNGVRNTFRYKLVSNTLLSLLSILIINHFGETLISLFLQGEGSPEDAAESLEAGLDYLHVMLIGLIPTGLSFAYSGTLRDTGETKLPMTASVAAIFVNLAGNYILIYGHFGLPALGAVGAAAATVLSRFVELGILAFSTGLRSDTYPFIKKAFSTLRIPRDLALKFAVRSLPLIANETLWALSQTFMNQSYSYRSLDAVAALNIESTIWNLMGVSFLAMGEAVGIIVGQELGKGKIKEAKDDAAKLIAFTVLCGTVFGAVMVIIAPFFPLIYNTSESIKHMAAGFIMIYGILMPLYAFNHASYFTIRSGGNTLITFVFDSCFAWVISVPSAFLLSRYTSLNVTVLIASVQSLELIKCIIGFKMIRGGAWAKMLTADS